MPQVEELPSGRFRVRWFDAAGNRHSPPNLTFPTKSAARAYGHDQEAKIRQGDYRDPRSGQVLLRDWIKQWQESRIGEDRTLGEERRTIDRYILKGVSGAKPLGDLKLDQIDELVVQAWVKRLEGAGLSPSSVCAITASSPPCCDQRSGRGESLSTRSGTSSCPRCRRRTTSTGNATRSTRSPPVDRAARPGAVRVPDRHRRALGRGSWAAPPAVAAAAPSRGFPRRAGRARRLPAEVLHEGQESPRGPGLAAARRRDGAHLATNGADRLRPRATARAAPAPGWSFTATAGRCPGSAGRPDDFGPAVAAATVQRPKATAR
jgi:hypothetical protein